MTTSHADIESVVTEYVHRLAGRWVDTDEPIISSRLLESLAAVQLMDFLEHTFDITIEDEEIVVANFDSVGTIVTLVRGKMAVT